MIVLGTPDKRQQRHDYWLGGMTAAAAGIVNVCSVVAFFAFASNVTGHVAVLAEELVKGHWHQLGVVGAWVLTFLAGACVANLLVTTIGHSKPRLGRGLAVAFEIVILAAVAMYGHWWYRETLSETEYLVGALLFAMGLQNGLVATVSKGVVKTTHLTGLLTDLGMELSMVAQRRFARDADVRFKLRLHVLILVAYLVGGVFGAWVFVRIGFPAFLLGSALLGLMLVLDLTTARAGVPVAETLSGEPAWAGAEAGPREVGGAHGVIAHRSSSSSSSALRRSA